MARQVGWVDLAENTAEEAAVRLAVGLRRFAGGRRLGFLGAAQTLEPFTQLRIAAGIQHVHQRIDPQRIADSPQREDDSAFDPRVRKVQHLDQFVVDDALILVLDDLGIKDPLSVIALKMRQSLRNPRLGLGQALNRKQQDNWHAIEIIDSHPD